MNQDRYLAEAARAMIAAADRSQSVVRVLQRRCPAIYRQVMALRECRSLLALWGRSRNVDERTGQIIVHPAILQAIGHLAGVPLRGPVVHAGLEHTYGYLFSLAETPYGLKRERWTRATIEAGFGIRVPTLRPVPAEGTLLANLTGFAGRLAFRDRPRELRTLNRMADFVSPVVRQFPYARLKVCCVIEEVATAGAGGRGPTVRLQTDLVRFPCPPAAREADNHLLIYSVVTGPTAPARLITAFPVAQAVADQLTAPENQGELVMKGLPYNAYVRGLGGHALRTRRYMVRTSGH